MRPGILRWLHRRKTQAAAPDSNPAPARVLHVNKLYRPVFTGEGVFIERCSVLMQTIAPHVAHDLLVTNVPRPDPLPRVCSTLGDVFYLCDSQVSELRRQLALAWWFITHLHRYQTLHFHVHVDWYFAGFAIAKLMGRRVILSATLDDSVPVVVSRYRPSLRPTALRMFRKFDGLVSISPKLQHETAAVMAADKCHLLPCGIDCPPIDVEGGRRVRQRLGIPPGAPVLIFVGGLCQRKDPFLLVRHLPDLLEIDPHIHLLLVGPELEPDYVTEMLQFISVKGIERHVIFTGEVRDPHPYFDAADIMAFPSHLEGLGTVVPEAMAHALPVVVRRLPGVNDFFVRDGENGCFFSDDAGYLDAVSRLLRQPELRRQLGACGRDRAIREFDMAHAARRYLEIYGFAPAPVATEFAPTPPRAALGSTASIVNRRLHAPASLDRLERPCLVTIIDAEEEFDWSAQFSRASTGVGSMLCQEPAQRILDRYDSVPTYMVDYPVVSHDAGRAPLRDMLQAGRCDIGTQLHAWVSPPFEEQVNNRNSYPGNLSVGLELEKVRCLTEAIEAALGTRPRIYRAGRYGAGTRTADILKHQGYLADTSVMPGWDFTAQEGPSFTRFSAQPHWLDEANNLLELPASSAVVGQLAGLPSALRHLVFAPPSEYLGLPSLTARLRLLERIKLSPEGITIPEGKRLIRHMLARGHKVFVLTYHTPSLVPGNTPYVRSRADLDRFLAWLDEIYGFFTGEIGGRCANWREIYDALHEQSPADRVVESAMAEAK
ncbi:MAG TPA: glycosyltransferase [Acetobacteraceae bacterium]|nr:glycosyltransferase [Acetobacteraceae bacterium]